MRTRHHRLLPLALTAIPSLAACGGSDEVSEMPLSGVIDGQAWNFVAGDTDSFLSGDDGFFASLYAEEFTACGFGGPEPPLLLGRIPKEPGEYKLGLSMSMTFVPSPGENLVATRGRLIVHEVTDTTVSAGLYARFDGDNEVDGQFTLTVCADD
jgi:hypothetical protein